MARKLVTAVDGGYIAEFQNTRKWFRRFVGPRRPEMLCLVYSASYDSLCFRRPIVKIRMDADAVLVEQVWGKIRDPGREWHMHSTRVRWLSA